MPPQLHDAVRLTDPADVPAGCRAEGLVVRGAAHPGACRVDLPREADPLGLPRAVDVPRHRLEVVAPVDRTPVPERFAPHRVHRPGFALSGLLPECLVTTGPCAGRVGVRFLPHPDARPRTTALGDVIAPDDPHQCSALVPITALSPLDPSDDRYADALAIRETFR